MALLMYVMLAVGDLIVPLLSLILATDAVETTLIVGDKPNSAVK